MYYCTRRVDLLAFWDRTVGFQQNPGGCKLMQSIVVRVRRVMATVRAPQRMMPANR